jgi:citrate lyase subunit beta / citryl-CoA lyase
MNEKRVHQAGSKSKADLIATYEPDYPGYEIVIESSVKKLFAKLIKNKAEEVCSRYNITKGRITIEDDGALDFIIWARVEAVLRMSGRNSNEKYKRPNRIPTHKDRLRRSRLYIPGNQPDLMLNAGLFGADSIILDLEDSVSPSQKDASRILIRCMLENAELFFPHEEVIVRINPLNGSFGHDDLLEIIPALPHVILIPKCESSSDIIDIEKFVQEIEDRYKITENILFMPLIETAKGVINAYDIAKASFRNVALCFGAEDFTNDLGIALTREGRETYYAKQQIVLAAKAADIQAMDTVYSDVNDEEGLFAAAKEAKSLGFSGKGIIHPRQVETVHKAFSPTKDELEEARKIVSLLKEAQEKGTGVISIGTKMIDAPVAKRAQRLIDLDSRNRN